MKVFIVTVHEKNSSLGADAGFSNTTKDGHIIGHGSLEANTTGFKLFYGYLEEFRSV